MQPKLSLDELAKQRIEAKGKLEELVLRQKAEREPYEQAIQAINELLLHGMKKAKQFTVGYEGFTISRKKSAKPVVVDERAAVASLNMQGKEHYVIPTISPEALKLVEKGSLALDGVTVETREFISIRQADKKSTNQ